MKILITGNGQISDNYGGGQVYVRNLIAGLLDSKHNVEYLSLVFSNIKVPQFYQQTTNGILTRQIVLPVSWKEIDTDKFDSAIGVLAQAFQNISPDIVHAHGWKELTCRGAAQAGVCQTCHDGVQSLGKSVPHIPTTAGASCDSAGCHTNLASVYNVAANAGVMTAWAGATYGHVGVVAGSCSTCHNGSYPGVTSQSNCYGSASACPQGATYAHPATSAPCDQCHTSTASVGYTTWANAGHTHVAADVNNCATSLCHGSGGSGKGITTNHIPPYSNSCDAGGCHASPVGVASPTFAGGNMVHTLYTAYTCTSCHSGTYTTFGTTGAVVKVTTHIPTTITGTLDCNTCHKGTPPNTAAASTGGATMWATGEAMNHNSAQGGGPVYCVTCHLTGVAYLGKMSKKSHNGASTAKDCSSSSCHIPKGKKGKAYTSWN